MDDTEHVLRLIEDGIAAVADESGRFDTAHATNVIVLSAPPELMEKLAALALPALLASAFPPPVAAQTLN